MRAPEGSGVPLVAGGDSLVAHRGVVGYGTDSWVPESRPAGRAYRPARIARGLRRGLRAPSRENGGVQRPVPSSIPDSPGSYQFKDATGRVLYVGKAKSLRSRVMSYFGTGLAERTRQMVELSDTVEWIAVRNEVEALFLEFNLIKKHRPRFNIRLKDDKSYPYLAITLDEEWPRAMVMRGAKRKGVRYFGPYAHAYAIRETLDLLLRTFPIRTCTKGKFDRHHRLGRPCLYAHIEKCVAPCVGAVTHEEYMGLVNELIDFLDGETAPVLDRLEKQMHESSDALDFERAARLRDQIFSVRKAIERQQMVDAKEEDYDAIGIADDPLEASVQVFLVRKGRVVGRKGLVVDKVEDIGRAELVGRLLEQLYGDVDPSDIPREILVPDDPDDPELYQEFLTLQRGGRGPRARAASGGQARAARYRHPERDRSVPAPQAAPGLGSQRAAPVPWSRCRTRSGSPTRRCASSATTSRTCRAPRSSPRWWSWKTACPSDPTTAGSRSASRRVKTTSRPWRRC